MSAILLLALVLFTPAEAGSRERRQADRDGSPSRPAARRAPTQRST